MNSYFDSVEKMRHYLVALSLVPDGDLRPPTTLAVSHTFWRDYTCPAATETINVVIERDIPLIKRLVFLLDRYNVPNRANALIDLLYKQAEILLSGGQISAVTNVA